MRSRGLQQGGNAGEGAVGSIARQSVQMRIGGAFLMGFQEDEGSKKMKGSSSVSQKAVGVSFRYRG